MRVNLNQAAPPKKRPHTGKKSKRLSQWLLASTFVPLGVELMRLIEEVVKILTR
jgi:hypothetical protein